MKICSVCLKDIEHEKTGARYPVEVGQFRYICRQCSHLGWTFDKYGNRVRMTVKHISVEVLKRGI